MLFLYERALCQILHIRDMSPRAVFTNHINTIIMLITHSKQKQQIEGWPRHVPSLPHIDILCAVVIRDDVLTGPCEPHIHM